MQIKNKNNKGFTLIELLIVIAIIAILASAVFVVLDPLTRFKDARNSTRASDATQILSAIKIDQVDNGGSYIAEIAAMTNGEWYMIVDGGGGTAMTSGCDDNNAATGTSCTIDADTNCVDLDGLVTEGYLGSVPISPAGVVTWDSGSTSGDEGTGYALRKEASGVLKLQACESEGDNGIEVAR